MAKMQNPNKEIYPKEVVINLLKETVDVLHKYGYPGFAIQSLSEGYCRLYDLAEKAGILPNGGV